MFVIQKLKRKETKEAHLISKQKVIFCDASVSSNFTFAVGAFLVLDCKELDSFGCLSFEGLKKFISTKIEYVYFETHKSTYAEIKTFLCSMKYLDSVFVKHIYVYTDCQTIIDLYEKRKKKLLDNNFRKKNGELLEHANLYREFFSSTDNYVLHFKKVKGHSPKQNKNLVPDLIFSIIDSFSRKRMRSVVNKPC